MILGLLKLIKFEGIDIDSKKVPSELVGRGSPDILLLNLQSDSADSQSILP